jgi:8-oxo-dGTP pyrophosphatase MutT (NUDIX family)
MEKFDLYDKNFHKLHKTMNRGDTNNTGEYHLVVHIWIKNSDNLFLIQQRNKLDDQVPFQWACTGGAALKGESSLEAVLRETKEEIGLTINQSNLQLLKRYFINHEKANYITDLYILKEDILLKDLKLDTLEVRDVLYKTMPEIKQMIKDNQFWDYERILIRNGYFNLLEKS